MDSCKPVYIKDTVQVAVNIRPLIGSELLQGCRDCVNVVSGEPQIQLGSHCFTYDYVYGSESSSLSKIFKDCVAPLVDGLFYGYNATVLAYGQTGSGKTYTMGTGYTPGGNNGGVIPQVMETIFTKLDSMRDTKTQFHIRVSFIEILKEEIHDLLVDPPFKPDSSGMKMPTLARPSIQIRENTAGEITLAGISEIDVKNVQEMAACLAQGSLARATGSTNMNIHSSRSHAIFTITLEQRRKSTGSFEGVCDDFLCGKLHLVDLAGSERAKKTGTDGARFKEGVHINRGLLALGNVISVLGEDRKRKETRHVPYRDSKLTRLLQDSLGGNSRTVMIACISPADSNAEETLNTLKYANRARNIQNKPIVNRDPTGTEMQKIRQQMSVLQAELLLARASECSPAILEGLKQKLASVEHSNEALRKELQASHESYNSLCERACDAQAERDRLLAEVEQLHSRKEGADESERAAEMSSLMQNYAAKIRDLESELQQLRTSCSLCASHSQLQSKDSPSVVEAGNTLPNSDVEEDAMTSKEVEHHLFLRESMDKELHELNRQLKEKEAEMQGFDNCDVAIVMDEFDKLEKKILELEEVKKSLQTLLELASDEHAKNIHFAHSQKLKEIDAQILDYKKRQEKETDLLKLKQQSDDSAVRLGNEIHRIKQQKVHLQHRIKQESEHFRTWKACREKELLKLRKEGRRNEYEMHKLQALHERQKQVLHRKTEEAAAVSRRLKEVLEARRQAARENSLVSGTGYPGKLSTKTFQLWFDQELENAVRLREARLAYEKQNIARETMGKDEDDMQNAPTSPCETEAPSMSSFLNGPAESLDMSSSVDPDDEQYRIKGPVRWQQVRTLGDAKDLLNFVFNVAACARCRLRDKENENKELKERLGYLFEELRETMRQKEELEQLMPRAAAKTESEVVQAEDLILNDLRVCYDENNSSDSNPEDRQEACRGTEDSGTHSDSRAGKSRAQQVWPLQFRWKWQKPWRLAQWIRQNEKAIRSGNTLRVLDMI